MIKLVSTFLNSEGKKHNLTIKNPDTTKSPEEIKESLSLLSSLELFEKDGVTLFQEVVKAKFVETIERPIFEGDKLFGDPAPIEENPEEVTLAQEIDTPSLEELKAKSSWCELPQVPKVSLVTPVNEEISANVSVDNSVNNPIPVNSSPIEPCPPLKPYDIVTEMIKRRMRRKAKEKAREHPVDS